MSWVGFLMVLCITVSFVSDPMAAMFFGQRPSGKRMMLKDRLQNRREKEFPSRNKLSERELSQRKRAFKRFMAHKDAKFKAELH